MSEQQPLDAKDRAAMIAWAKESVDWLSWRADYALDHPGESIVTGNGWDERAQDELLHLAEHLYARVVPVGYLVTKEE